MSSLARVVYRRSLRFGEFNVLWHHSIRYGISVQRYRCQACRRIFQTLRRGKDPALKQQACQLYLEGM